MSTQQTIADLAYALWQARGCPEASAEVDWAEAERQVMAAKPIDIPDMSSNPSATAFGELLR